MVDEIKERIKDLEKKIKLDKKILKEKEKELLQLKQELENLQRTPEIKEKEQKQKEKSFNGLTAKEWASYSRSVWNDLSSARDKKHLDHGATFPEKLADRIIRMYSKEGDKVLDPFLGTGTTGLAAITSKRDFVGIELSQKYYSYSMSNLLERSSEIGNLFNQISNFEILNGDCLQEIKNIEDNSIQLTFTSPPYADLIHKIVKDREKTHKNSAFVLDNNATTKIYSDHELDLGNMALPEYEEAVKKLMKRLYQKTKVGGYNVWVVKDFRDTQNKIPYIDLHTLIAKCGESAGFKYHDLIIWDQNEQRRLVLLGYPSRFYINQNNSFIIVLRKWEER